MTSKKVTPEEALACEEAALEWVDSYDTKDWDRLARNLAPEVKERNKQGINYVGVNNINQEMSGSSFVQMMSSPGFLGDPLLRTQHLIGASKWRKISDTCIKGHHQIRTTHQRFAVPIVGDNAEGVEAVVKAKSHVGAEVTYVLVRGEWKWGGVKTDIRWHDGPFVKCFKDF